MRFTVNPKSNPLAKHYRKDELDIAERFANRVIKEFGSFVKAVVLFGSSARNSSSGKGDVDVLVVINDLTIVLSAEVVETYRVIMEKLIAEISKKIHLTTLRMTNFYEYVRTGDPVAINILRDGVALVDTGFFDPLQALLYRGRIRPTYESIWTYMNRAPNTMWNSRWHVLQATLDLYWAVIDSAHAALMKIGEIPPSPEHVADMLEEKLVNTKIIGKRYSRIMRNFYNLSKQIIRREIKDIQGAEYDRHYKEAQDFVDTMKAFVEKK